VLADWGINDFIDFYENGYGIDNQEKLISVVDDYTSFDFINPQTMLYSNGCVLGPENCFGDPGDTGYVPPVHVNIDDALLINTDNVYQQDTHQDETYYFKVYFPETGWYSIYTYGTLDTQGRLYENSSGYPTITNTLYDNGTGRGDDLTNSNQFFTSYYGVLGESVIIGIRSQYITSDASTELRIYQDNYHKSNLSDYEFTSNSVVNNKIYLIDNTSRDTLLNDSIDIWNELDPIIFYKTTTSTSCTLEVADVTYLPSGTLGLYGGCNFIHLNDNTMGNYNFNIQLNVMLHEMGHAIGINHVDDFEDIYNPSLMWSQLDLYNPKLVPGPVDVALYKYLWD
jgi:hypothetical protein